MDCDTKNEIDDQFAIAYALKSPEINLLGVVSVQNCKRNGRRSVDIYHKEAEKILTLAESKIKAYKGSRRPLRSENKLERSDGVDFIIRSALKADSHIYVVCTGPATDIANACLVEPRIIKKCKFFWMGGFKNGQESKKFRHREVNFCGDKKAAKLLFELGLDLTLIPMWGVADHLIIQNHTFAEELRETNTPLNNYLANLIKSNWRRRLIHRYLPQVLKRYWVFADIVGPAVAKNLGIAKSHITTSVMVEKGRMVFRKNSVHLINRIEKIDCQVILKDFQDLILK